MTDAKPDSWLSPGVAHLLGDYVVQSDWMANEKVNAALPAAAHAVTYAACFLPLTRSLRALAVIGGTHYVIDRYRLARYVVWAKNQAAPRAFRYPWSHGARTGYHHGEVPPDGSCTAPSKPDWLAMWLMIVADNALHVTINEWALRRWA